MSKSKSIIRFTIPWKKDVVPSQMMDAIQERLETIPGHELKLSRMEFSPLSFQITTGEKVGKGFMVLFYREPWSETGYPPYPNQDKQDNGYIHIIPLRREGEEKPQRRHPYLEAIFEQLSFIGPVFSSYCWKARNEELLQKEVA